MFGVISTSNVDGAVNYLYSSRSGCGQWSDDISDLARFNTEAAATKAAVSIRRNGYERINDVVMKVCAINTVIGNTIDLPPVKAKSGFAIQGHGLGPYSARPEPLYYIGAKTLKEADSAYYQGRELGPIEQATIFKSEGEAIAFQQELIAVLLQEIASQSSSYKNRIQSNRTVVAFWKVFKVVPVSLG